MSQVQKVVDPTLNSMGGSNLKIAGGVDTLHLFASVGDWDRFDAAELEAAKTEAASQKKGYVVTAINGVQAVVYASGLRAAGVYYRYKIEVLGATMFIAPGNKRDTAIKIEFGSESLMAVGRWESLYVDAASFLGSLGAVLLKVMVSRCDVCCDFAGLGVEGFYAKFGERAFISRARMFDQHQIDCHVRGLVPQSVNFGRGVIRCRIYDKLAESRNSPEKLSLLMERWGCPDPEQATRIEFQFRREALVELGCGTADELSKNISKLATYGVEDYLRFLERATDRRQSDRAETWSVWREVQNAFASVFGHGIARREKRKPVIDCKALVRQAVGCLQSAFASCTNAVADTGKFVEAVAAFVTGETESSGFSYELAERIAVYRVRHALLSGL
jgi:hypothetical protein